MTADRGRPIRVLHVEDDPDFAEVAATVLEREHPRIEVETAEDADAGLSRLAGDGFHCVVSDYDMPGTDGLEFLEAVREEYPELPFVLFTGKGSEEIAGEAISAGVTDYIQKSGGREQYAMLANRIENAVERYRTEAALREERRRFELIGRASADAFWDWDVETGEVERNEGYERIFGFDAEEVGEEIEWWAERIHPDDRETVREQTREAILSGDDTIEMDYRVETAGGTYKDVYTRAQILRDDDGHAERVVGAVTDISDVKRRERELERVRARLELVLEGTDTGVWEWDPETDEVVWDRTVERIFGVPPGTFEGTFGAFRRRVHEEDRERVEASIERALTDGVSYDVEFRIRREDGEVRWVKAKGVPPGDGDERPGRFVGLINDVTARKEHERELQQYETILETVPDGIFVLDEHATIEGGNQTASRMLGFEREELVGTRFERLVEDGVVEATVIDRYESAVRRLLSSESDDEMAQFEFDATVDGEDRTFEGRVALRPFDDDYRGTIGIVRDVTEQKDRQLELERYETLLSLIPDTVTVTDTDGRLVEIHGYVGWTGFDREELAGEHVSMVMPEEDVERAESVVGELIRDDDREKATFEQHVRTAEGELVPFENHTTLLPPDDDGMVPGNMSVLRDISDRKEREERLRRSERRFEAIFDDPSAFIGLLEPDGTLVLVNDTAVEFVGAEPDEVTGRHFVDTPWWTDATPEKRAEIERGIERAAAGEFVRFEATHTGVDDRTIGVEGHIRPVTDESGTVVSLLVEGIDVTDRLDHEQRIEGLHETTRELVRADDPDEVAEMVTRAATDILDLSKSVVRLREGDELRPVAYSEAARETFGERPVRRVGEGLVGRVYEEGEPMVFNDLDAVDDDSHPDSARSSVLIPIGEYGTLSIAGDEPDAFDDSDVALAQVLANNVAVVLDRLEGEQTLRRRERALTRQNERLDRFARIVSHDLRNPLAVAEGNLDLVAEETAGEHVEKVASALDRMDEIVDDVLTLARGNEQVVDPEPTSLDLAVRGAWQSVDSSRATLEVDGDLGTLPADASRLQQLLENLFRNAVEHAGPDVTVEVGRLGGGAPEGGSTANGPSAGRDSMEPAGNEASAGTSTGESVATGNLPEGRPTAPGSVGDGQVASGFYVEDDGPGIPESEREAIFEFGRTGRDGGTGFGLSIVEEIAEAHDWAVVATEGEAGGARFEVTGVGSA